MKNDKVAMFDQFPPPRDERCPFDPPPELVRRLHEEPISKIRIWDGTEAWLITRFDDGRAALSDDRFSADPRRPGFPEKNIAYASTIGTDRNLRVMDNPEHDLQKRKMIRDFTVKRVEELRPYVQEVVDRLIDEMLLRPKPIDLISNFAVSLPTLVICELLGVPYEDREFFSERTEAVLSSPTAEEAIAAGNDLSEFIERLIDLKIASPANDLISRMVHDYMLKGEFGRDELVSLGRLLLIAGHNTTASMIGLSTLFILQNPKVAAEFRSNKDTAFFRNAVDELLRYLGTNHAGRRRVAISDVVIGGQLIKAGEGIIVQNNVMDRDETVFTNADQFDSRRPNARATSAFGYGIHQCAGQSLARMELVVVHSTLWTRIPNLRLAIEFDQVPFFEHGPSYKLKSLPVTW